MSKKAIDFARKQYAEKNRRLKKEIQGWSDKVFLNRARLTINGKITNAAILLLGKPESEHYISPAQAKITWVLKDRDGVEKDYEHFSCPIILSAQQVFKKIRNITYRYMQEGSLFPEEVLQYDPYLIREALNNCIAHQDYTLGGKIVVVENEDGCFVSYPFLDVAQKKNFVERKNVNAATVADAVNAMTPTTFAQIFAQTFAQTFAQRLRSKFKQDSSFKKACEDCEKLIKLLIQNPNVSSQELAESLNLSRRTISTYLKYLVEAELLKRIGPDNGGHWEVLMEQR